MNGDPGGVRKISLESAEHYSWGNGCDGWHLVNHPQLSVIRERMPPGAAEVRHRHHAARQFFFVLSGVAVLEADGTEHQLQTGEGLQVDPGVPHQIFNRSKQALELVVVSQPHSHGDREVVGSCSPDMNVDDRGKRAAARRLERMIGKILLEDWDPIGIRGVPEARDEYDRYVGGVYGLLASGAGPEAVVEHLLAIEAESMGLTPAGRNDRLAVAAKLCELKVRLE